MPDSIDAKIRAKVFAEAKKNIKKTQNSAKADKKRKKMRNGFSQIPPTMQTMRKRRAGNFAEKKKS